MAVNANLAELLRAAARRTPAAVALVEESRTWTWEHLDAEVDAIVAGLVHRGVRPSDRIAIQQGNTAGFVQAYFAILRAGGIAVPINPGLTAAQTAVLLADSGARLVICDAQAADVTQQAVDAVPTCEALVMDSGAWRALTAVGRRTALIESVTPGDALALLMFTAGTSARAKGVMLTHGALRSNVEMLLALQAPAAVRADDVVLAVVPLFHIYGLNAVLMPAVAVGARVVLLDRFDAAEALTVVREQHVSVVAGTPAMYQAWSRMADLGAGLSTMRLFVSGGAGLPAEVLERFTARAGVGIYEGYGMTEAGPVIASALVSGRAKAGSVGRPLPGVEVSLRDGSGAPVPEGDPGDVWVRSPGLFRGYWPDGAAGPDAHGWFRSGDVAFIDANEDLHVLDRRREVILVNGFSVYPQEVEAVIKAIPGVLEVAVVAVPDDRTGESVAALVVAEPGETVSVADVEGACAQRLARFKWPASVRIVPELPHALAGNVAKGRLREVHSVERSPQTEREPRTAPARDALADEPRVLLVGKPDCHLCDIARGTVAAVCADLGIAWRERSITDDPRLAAEYAELIPVVLVDGEHHAHWRIWPDDLRTALTGGVTSGAVTDNRT